MKKILVIFLILICCVGSVFADDDYPDKNSDINSYHPTRLFYYRQCTDFAAWCLISRNGVSDFSNWYGGQRWGNAVTWGTVAQSLGITVDSNPAVGAVAWWNTGTYGHVAWVAQVNGSTVTIEEYNNTPYAYSTREIFASSPTGYIHISDIEDTPQDIYAPKVWGVTVTDISCDGYMVTCHASDDYGLKKVVFSTRSENADDNISTDGIISGDVVICRINTSDHNDEDGWYFTSIHAYDTSDNVRSFNESDFPDLKVYIPTYYIPIDEAHFPDPVLREYVRDNFDIDKNDMLYRNEIKNASGINIDRSALASLQGIEFLTELRALNVGLNPSLTEIDVSGNPNLNSISCGYNGITSLDLSNHSQLEQVICNNNSIVTLNVDGCTELQRLYCYNNQLTTLDVSQCPKLEFLECNSNQLEMLDVSKNSNLKTLVCLGNNLSSINVSRNTLLETLSVGSNQISALDIQNNPHISELICSFNSISSLNLNNNSKIVRLDCSNNPITSLDIHNLSLLESLFCRNTQLTILDIGNCTLLKELFANGNSLTDIDINNNALLEELIVDNNKLTTLDISNNPLLSFLYFSNNHLTSFESDHAIGVFIASDNVFSISTINHSFDLKNLPGSFDVSRTSNWMGGTVNGTILTATSSEVTYDYDCGNDQSIRFTLAITDDTVFLGNLDPAIIEMPDAISSNTNAIIHSIDNAQVYSIGWSYIEVPSDFNPDIEESSEYGDWLVGDFVDGTVTFGIDADYIRHNVPVRISVRASAPGYGESYAEKTFMIVDMPAISFDTGDGSHIEPIIQEAGTPITLPDNPIKTGAVFAGWAPEIPMVMPDYDLWVRAQWGEAIIRVNALKTEVDVSEENCIGWSSTSNVYRAYTYRSYNGGEWEKVWYSSGDMSGDYMYTAERAGTERYKVRGLVDCEWNGSELVGGRWVWSDEIEVKVWPGFVLPTSLRSIESEAFSGVPVNRVKVPNGTEIANDAFDEGVEIER